MITNLLTSSFNFFCREIPKRFRNDQSDSDNSSDSDHHSRNRKKIKSNCKPISLAKAPVPPKLQLTHNSTLHSQVQLVSPNTSPLPSHHQTMNSASSQHHQTPILSIPNHSTSVNNFMENQSFSSLIQLSNYLFKYKNIPGWLYKVRFKI